MILDETKKYYVYSWLRKDGSPYYIGKGTGFRAYCNRPYKPLDKNRIQIIEDKLTEKQAFDLEEKLIAKYGRKDRGTGILKNKTDGGDGPALSEEAKRKISLAGKGRTPWNKGLTADTSARVKRNALSKKTAGFSSEGWASLKKNKGRIHSEEVRKRMSEGQKGKVYPTQPCEVCGRDVKVNGMAMHIKAHNKKVKSNYFIKMERQRWKPI